jgi:hypothetical protein
MALRQRGGTEEVNEKSQKEKKGRLEKLKQKGK